MSLSGTGRFSRTHRRSREQPNWKQHPRRSSQYRTFRDDHKSTVAVRATAKKPDMMLSTPMVARASVASTTVGALLTP